MDGVMEKPSKFVLCFENHATDGLVWALKVGRTWTRHREIVCFAPLKTVYKGREARQPRAYMVGEGVIGYEMANDRTVIR